jgi:hypothetical protein
MAERNFIQYKLIINKITLVFSYEKLLIYRCLYGYYRR